MVRFAIDAIGLGAGPGSAPAEEALRRLQLLRVAAAAGDAAEAEVDVGRFVKSESRLSWRTGPTH